MAVTLPQETTINDSVVPFEIEPIDRPQVAPSFIPRPRKPVIQKELKEHALKLVGSVSTVNANGNGNGKNAAEITSEMIDGLDVGF